jgi:hypothetical protein
MEPPRIPGRFSHPCRAVRGQPLWDAGRGGSSTWRATCDTGRARSRSGWRARRHRLPPCDGPSQVIVGARPSPVTGGCGVRVEGGTNAAHLGQAPAFRLHLRPLLAAQSDRRVMSSPEASHVGAQLDEDHAPETNGRMSVCRRCGARTDEAALHHVPDERQLDRSSGWLIAQVQRSRIERARKLHQDRIR